jgi:hypothetical protein
VIESVDTGLTNETYAKFIKGETAITADGRAFAVTDQNFVVLHRREHYMLALPGRNIGQLDFGNKPVLCGDIDLDRDVDIFDLTYLCDGWLCHNLSMDIAPLIRDDFVDMLDFAKFADAWHSQKGAANWNKLCDTTPPGGNDFVAVEDLEILADEWLWEGSGYNRDVDIAANDNYVNFIDFDCLAGNWGVAENIIKYDEDFETGSFSHLPWVHSGNGPWTIVSNEKFQGIYSAKSGDVTRYDESILSVTVTCGEGNVRFMLKNIGDGQFTFWVDDDLPYDHDGYYDGTLDWSLVAIPVTAGTHTFKWSYTPNTYGEVHAWIDAIRFPPE